MQTVLALLSFTMLLMKHIFPSRMCLTVSMNVKEPEPVPSSSVPSPKNAGFTGVRCGYTVVPKELTAATLEGKRIPLNRLWNRRQCTKFNGTSYITQRGAEAIYSPEGKEQIKATIHYYMTNARIMKEALESTGLKVFRRRERPLPVGEDTG